MAGFEATTTIRADARPKHRFVVKAQRSIEPKGQMLFYNQHRTRLMQYPLSPTWDRHFGRNDKLFCEVDWPDDASPPSFVQYVRWRNW
jgi:hypothetical protein